MGFIYLVVIVVFTFLIGSLNREKQPDHLKPYRYIERDINRYGRTFKKRYLTTVPTTPTKRRRKTRKA